MKIDDLRHVPGLIPTGETLTFYGRSIPIFDCYVGYRGAEKDKIEREKFERRRAAALAGGLPREKAARTAGKGD